MIELANNCCNLRSILNIFVYDTLIALLFYLLKGSGVFVGHTFITGLDYRVGDLLFYTNINGIED